MDVNFDCLGRKLPDRMPPLAKILFYRWLVCFLLLSTYDLSADVPVSCSRLSPFTSGTTPVNELWILLYLGLISLANDIVNENKLN